MTFVVTRQHAQWVHDMARARDGLPYAYGGAFTHDPNMSTDCSGLVLQTAAWYGGRTDWPGNRYGSTESFRLDYKIVYDLGFKRLPPGGVAALPFRPVMLVGLQHGGGGVYSHTSCTLLTMDIPGGPVKVSGRGVDWESQGNGVFLYEGARPWNDSLFHDFWYLDAVLEESQLDPNDVLARATGVSYDRAAELLPAVRDGLIQSECTNPNRIAMWLAQIGHESDGFNATAEYASGDAYDTRTDLGNTPEVDGDGRLYKGRSWIMITGKHNFREFSEWAHSRGLVPTPTYFVDHPLELSELRWAGIGPAWYWTVARPTINTLSDRRDPVGVTRLINGGTHGLADRQARYDRALGVGDQLLALLDGEVDWLDMPDNAAKLDYLYNEFHKLFGSRSPYRVNDDRFETTVGFLLNNDRTTHMGMVEDAARNGEDWALGLVAAVASGSDEHAGNWLWYTDADGNKQKDHWAIGHARAVLNDIEATNPDVLRRYLAEKGQA